MRQVKKKPARTTRPPTTKKKAVLKKKVTAAKPVRPRARAASKAGFKKKELEHFRALLVEEQERLKQELEEIEERAARALEIEAAGELSGYDDHPADVASETFEREKDLAIGDNVSSLLARIRSALAKIEDGTYGICDICRGPIKRARLKAIPFATLCVDCQGRVEAR
jgi:RNA polymerase-binding protein DksA